MDRRVTDTVVAALIGAAVMAGAAARTQAGITQTERGAVVETGRFRIEFRNGALVSLHNKLTNEDGARGRRGSLRLFAQW